MVSLFFLLFNYYFFCVCFVLQDQEEIADIHYQLALRYKGPSM